jgi:putative phage-type endonuclease
MGMGMSITDEQIKQGTAAWRRARMGSLGAASIYDALAKLKSGKWAASRAKIMDGLIAERLTGIPWNGYKTPAMQWGLDHEAEARAAYEAYVDAKVVQVGLTRHPTIEWAHASPDGLVADDGLIEIKCPTTATHLEILSTGLVPTEYVTQMQWQLACTGRDWCEFVSYDPRVSPAINLFITPIDRDDNRIAALEDGAREFLAEIEARLDVLRRRFGDLTPPPPPSDVARELGFEPIGDSNDE